MNNKFDELAKNLAQSVTRREAFKKFGVGVAGMVLACFGLAGVAEANNGCIQEGGICNERITGHKCCKGLICGVVVPGSPPICSTGVGVPTLRLK